MGVVPEKCPYCGSTSIGVGYQIGGGRLYVDAYAYHSSTAGSDVETFLCRDCGSILYARALRPEIFQSAGDAHREALRAYMEENGFLLLNAHATLPSADALGYSMETLVQLAERREAVYTKALAGRAVYLSPRAFRLLCRVKPQKPLTEAAQQILRALRAYDGADKETLCAAVQMEKKSFSKAFDFLLENLYVTVCAGRRLTPSWYAYIYCTREQFCRGLPELHVSGDPKDALWAVVGKTMDEKSFAQLCR